VVGSFSEGVLTVTLPSGQAVSGQVTAETDLRCLAPAAAEGSGDGQGDDGAGSSTDESLARPYDGRGGSEGEGAKEGSPGGDREEGEKGESGDDGGPVGQGGDDEGESAARCTSSSLAAGAVIGGAQLTIGPTGAVWQSIEVIL